MTATIGTRIGIIAAATAAGSLFLIAPAGAQSAAQAGRDGVRAAGSCTGSTDWTLKAKTDDGRIEFEFEVDSNRNGQTWRVNVKDNGVTVFNGSRVTTAPSGSFSLEEKIANRAGTDRITARARNTVSGELCVGTVRL